MDRGGHLVPASAHVSAGAGVGLPVSARPAPSPTPPSQRGNSQELTSEFRVILALVTCYCSEGFLGRRCENAKPPLSARVYDRRWMCPQSHQASTPVDRTLT